MKFAILALVAVVKAADEVEGDEKYTKCETAEDCEKNFDALVAQWEADESEDKVEPKKGELACPTGNFKGKDEESGADYDVNLKICTPKGACGWSGEKDGVQMSFNCDNAQKLLAGVASIAAIAYAL